MDSAFCLVFLREPHLYALLLSNYLEPSLESFNAMVGNSFTATPPYISYVVVMSALWVQKYIRF
jgi:hypothetical protein